MSAEDAPTKTISDFEATLVKADTAVASFERDDKSITHILRGLLRKNPTLIPALVLLVSIAAFSIIAPRFFGMGALSIILKQVTVTGFIALAQTLVILTAGIDLSVGAILVISSLIMGNLAVVSGLPVLLAVGIGVFFGGVMGFVNGVLVAKVKLP
ncbi:MAG: ABC transporter permease, partial [Rhodobacteraceae bacterium]|nr:ABC transporter permease [Paracoccaceae bacterium]